MKIRNVFIITVLMAMVTMPAPATLVWAGGDPGTPPNWANVVGPEIWGTAVVYCKQDTAMTNFLAMRVKRIKDCNVQTQALVLLDGPDLTLSGCPENANEFLYQTLPTGTFFPGDEDIPTGALPIVTKIKNWKIEYRDETGANATMSFDAQIKFLNQ